jgi:hypothetical protein
MAVLVLVLAAAWFLAPGRSSWEESGEGFVVLSGLSWPSILALPLLGLWLVSVTVLGYGVC